MFVTGSGVAGQYVRYITILYVYLDQAPFCCMYFQARGLGPPSPGARVHPPRVQIHVTAETQVREFLARFLSPFEWNLILGGFLPAISSLFLSFTRVPLGRRLRREPLPQRF